MSEIKKKLITAFLAAGLTSTSAFVAYDLTLPAEGLEQRVYLDPVGLPTACVGHMDKSLKVGQTFTIEQCMEIAFHKTEDFLLISGDDVQAVPIISIGGVGVMSVIANAFPRQFTDMIHAALAGDYKSAQKALAAFLMIDPYLYEEGNPVGVKKILALKGMIQGQVRMPLAEGSDALGKKLEQIIQQVKLTN